MRATALELAGFKRGDVKKRDNGNGQGLLFDATGETKKRDRGMAVSAANNDRSLELARQAAIAAAIRRSDRTCDVELVRAQLDKWGVRLHWGNWAGSLFKTGEWVPVSTVNATHVGSHRRRILRWQLKY